MGIISSSDVHLHFSPNSPIMSDIGSIMLGIDSIMSDIGSIMPRSIKYG
jgi:hypothetical protein